MCGIVGIVANGACVAPDVLERATQSLAHRGPDDSGTIILRESVPHPVEIGLGNRRLAILDLSFEGHQPMRDAATGNWIAYNGEIYNFRDVRKELEAEGMKFVSSSDTEVLLKAYGRWGENCLTKFRGKFAFAIWDVRQHRLFIARDPMGVKPLYYAQSGAYFIFASEARTIVGTGLVSKQIESAGLVNYLTFGSAYDPYTLIEGLRSLPAGHTLSWENGVVRISRYWDLVDETGGSGEDSIRGLDEEHAGEQLQPVLEEAVRLQLVSDVPVGVFLSGGIDSSALVSVLSRGGITPSTFSIVFREAEFSEGEFSRAIAQRFHTDHQRDYGFTIGSAGCDPGRVASHGPAHDGRRQYVLCFSRDAARRREGCVVRAGWRRSFCGLLQLSRGPSHGEFCALLEARTAFVARLNRFGFCRGRSGERQESKIDFAGDG